MLNALQDPLFLAYPCLRHGFFTRQGGISQGNYASLNCSYKSHDNPAAVTENNRRVLAHFNLPLEALLTVENTHGNTAVIVERPWIQTQRPKADALVTQKPGILLGSTSADCVTVLLCDPLAKVVGIAHAGWRGARNGILESTLSQMVRLGAKPNHIIASLSPSIAQASYEVSADFYQDFCQITPENARFFKPGASTSHRLFDLPGYVKSRLSALQLADISTACTFDTYTDPRFFSCRRAAHQGESDFGGHLACIGLLP